MKDVIVNWSYGDKCIESQDGEIFLNSLEKLPKEIDKVCFIHDVSNENIKKLKKYFNIIVPSVEKNPYTGHLDIYNWLLERQNEYEYVLQTDLRDVIFQKNPFEFMRNHPQYDMFYTLEGMKIQENDCNQFWHDSLIPILRSHNTKYDDSMIINGGIISGKVSHYCNHLLNIFTNTNRLNKYIVVDQQFLGYMYQFLKHNPRIRFCHPYEDTFCCTGEAIKRNNIDVYFDGTSVCNQKGEAYYIFHQWDRTELAQNIKEKETNTLRFSL
jgi:hypothetical protein